MWTVTRGGIVRLFLHLSEVHVDSQEAVQAVQHGGGNTLSDSLHSMVGTAIFPLTAS